MSDENSSGGRSLGGGNEPLPSSWAQPNSTRRIGRIGDLSGSSGSSGRGGSGGRIRTFADLSGGGGGAPSAHGHGHGARGHSPDEDEDDEDDDQEGESWFAGGERSGISVQNPDRPGGGGGAGVPGGNMVRDLLRRAAEGGPPPTAEAVSRTFTGGGHRLGSDEVESSYIPDPSAPEGEGEPTVRHLTFWRDGFTVEDGELMRYDDPNNASILEEIHAGRAPPSLLNVRAGDPVELRVARRTDEDYTPPKHAAFTGTGHRLGAPVPNIAGAGGSSSSGLPMPGSFAEAPQASASSSSREESSSLNTKFQVDQTQPMTSVQIRLADGTRIVCRMNLTHTVLDLRNFINASRPENLTRPYSIGTTFPNRTLDDLNATIEGAGLKNSVVVQKWE